MDDVPGVNGEDDDGYISDDVPGEAANSVDDSDNESMGPDSSSSSSDDTPEEREVFCSLTADEQIRKYEELMNVMYPDTRPKGAESASKHLLQRPVYYASTHPNAPRTTQEKQWMEEHTRPIYQTLDSQRQSGIDTGRWSANTPHHSRKSLHESYLSHKNDYKASVVRKSDEEFIASGFAGARSQYVAHPSKTEDGVEKPAGTSGRKSLAALAMESQSNHRGSHVDSKTKENLLALIHSSDFMSHTVDRVHDARLSKKSLPTSRHKKY